MLACGFSDASRVSRAGVVWQGGGLDGGCRLEGGHVCVDRERRGLRRMGGTVLEAGEIVGE